jgi:hypothetical protein
MGEGVIALCEDDGQAHLVSATSLGRLLDDHYPLRLVLLNACEGARSAMGALSSSAEVLVQRGVPAVVAMQYQITDEAAVQFSHAFYAAVASGQSAVASLTEARIAMSVANERSVEWAVPVLHQRAGSGQLFEIDVEQQRPKKWKSPLKALAAGWRRMSSRTRRIAAIGAGVLTTVALVAFLVSRLGSAPSPDLLWTFRTPGSSLRLRRWPTNSSTSAVRAEPSTASKPSPERNGGSFRPAASSHRRRQLSTGSRTSEARTATSTPWTR